MNDPIDFPGLGLVTRVLPATVPELGEAVADARAAGQAVYPVGGRTMLDLGTPPVKPGRAIDTTRLNGVIDYPARDLTITVQAGMTIDALNQTLAAENQWLPVDVPLSRRATVGGAIATNASGPHRFGHGTLRDAVIGIRFVVDGGGEVKGGGRVVKNVAGYDFMKLQTGALGTLGIITQVTFKVKPRPEAAAILAFGCSSAELAAMLDLLHASRSRPTAIELLNAAAWRETGAPAIPGDWILAVGYEEKAVTVDWQRATLLTELARETTPLTDFWSAVTDLQVRPASRTIGKACVRPSAVATIVNRIDRGDTLIHAQPLNGIIWMHDGELGPEFAVRRGPARPLPNSAERSLMKHIKATLDPDDLFNPGRLL